jgi:hypothetical protein
MELLPIFDISSNLAAILFLFTAGIKYRQVQLICCLATTGAKGK